MRRAISMACVMAVALGASLAAGQGTAAWSGKDAQGRDLAIPAEGKVTVLAFLRPGQGQTDEALKTLATLKDRADVQLIAVVSGDDAGSLAVALTRAKWTGPIIVDTDYALSGKSEVRVWPTTVIIGDQKAKGAIAGHLAGLPATFANDLAAYLDFAAGKTDKAALDRALANREVVAESGEQIAAPHVEVALRLAAKGLNDEAKAELVKAMASHSTDGAVLLSMARVNLVTSDPQHALAILDGIKDGATTGEINALRGWAAVEMEKWAEARKLLTDATTLNPDPAEAFYLLGRVCEHDGDLAKAAEYFRKAFEKSAGGKQMGAQGK